MKGTGMKNNFFIVTLAAALAVGTATAQDYTNSAPTNSSSFSQKWQNVKTGSGEAWQSMKQGSVNAWTDVRDAFGSNNSTNYSYSQKSEFVQKSRRNLASLDNKINQLAGSSSTNLTSTTSSIGSRIGTEANVQKLRAQETMLNQKLDNVQSASPSDWDKAKADFQQGYTDLKQAVKAEWNKGKGE